MHIGQFRRLGPNFDCVCKTLVLDQALSSFIGVRVCGVHEEMPYFQTELFVETTLVNAEELPCDVQLVALTRLRVRKTCQAQWRLLKAQESPPRLRSSVAQHTEQV